MRALMCSPDFIGIKKEINAWMDKWNPPDRKRARVEWLNLAKRCLKLAVDLWFIEPKPAYQDMSFPANAGWCRWGKLIFGNFVGKMASARKGELAHYQRWFKNHRSHFSDIELIPWPRPSCGFAGQGDVVTIGTKKEDAVVLMGHGQKRTSYEAHYILREIHGLAPHQVKPIHLIDQKLYDLDFMCLYIPPIEALPHTLIWYPPGTDRVGQSAIYDSVNKHDQIILTPEDAYNASCNGIFVRRKGNITILMHKPSAALRAKLQERGYRVIKQPMYEALKNGGTIRCSMLFIPTEEEV